MLIADSRRIPGGGRGTSEVTPFDGLLTTRFQKLFVQHLSVPDRRALELRLRSFAKTDRSQPRRWPQGEDKSAGNRGPVDAVYVNDRLVKQLELRENRLSRSLWRAT